MILLGVIIQLPSIPSQPFLRSTVLYPPQTVTMNFQARPWWLFFDVGKFNHGKNSLHVSISDFCEFFFSKHTVTHVFFFCMVSKFGWFQIGVCSRDVRFQRCIGWTSFCSFPWEFSTEVHPMKLGKLDFGKMAEDHFGW